MTKVGFQIITRLLLFIGVTSAGNAFSQSAGQPLIADVSLVKAVKSGLTGDLRQEARNLKTLNLYTDKKKKHNLVTLATLLGNEKTVSELIGLGADPDFKANERTALSYAVEQNNIVITQILLRAGADPNVKDHHKRTVIHYLKQEDGIAIAKLLTDYGADVNETDNAGKSVLQKLNGEKFPILYQYLQKMSLIQTASVEWPPMTDGPYVSETGDSVSRITWYFHDSVQRKTFLSDTLIRRGDRLTFRDRLTNRRQSLDLSLLPESCLINNENPDTLVVVGDVHGDYHGLLNILTTNNIIDSSLHWRFGKNTLIFIGDLVDRGDKVTETLWFVHNLMCEAHAYGGDVVYLLGNHEELLLVGDASYVSGKYSSLWNYFMLEPSELFSTQTYLGRWMRTRPSLIKIGNVLFVHGGISSELVKMRVPVDTINHVVSRFLMSSQQPLLSDTAKLILLDKGPLWSRSYFGGYDTQKTMTDSVVDATLSYYDVEKIVIGHTEVPEIKSLYNGKILALNVPFYKGRPAQILMITHGRFYKLTGKGQKVEL